MADLAVRRQRALRHYGTPATTRVRLLCFHYAGGNAAMFRDWPDRLPADVATVAVQLPGRDTRLDEPPHVRMGPLVEELLDVLDPLLDEPFACYGHSMGARVALALAHALRARARPGPRALFVASSAAPALRSEVRGWDEPDEGLIAYLRDLGGTPPIVFERPDLLELFLPALRADLTAVATSGAPARPPLDVPLRAFAGADDGEASGERMAAWREETTGSFELEVVPGGHFFDQAGVARVLDVIAATLAGPR
ncbi:MULTISPECIES: thioesterase II family protein [Saccharothrix]|uniref:Surfactin synthase thioesterase subunit n=1 Tax=Saccharothrix texasensis TaxID=103734 RepID=A0A3N1GZ40_9PSEU|nr:MULTISPECIES: thioesterase domain-containing protein [Saccharothrix]ROP35581.1 surfactin synthase thioesterase subunit [Saccharothrix texasensis]